MTLCPICQKQMSPEQLLPGRGVQDCLVPYIQRTFPAWKTEDVICLDDLDRFRTSYITEVLQASTGEISTLSEDIQKSLRDQEIQARDLNAEFERQSSRGEQVADAVASFGGSWRFIILFCVIIVLWIIINCGYLLKPPFDPYPFILLNLLLSCIAALQAPVIMMSQNRLEDRDRLRAENDYRVNLKAELEIRHLHEKMDYLLAHQLQRLMEVQQMQIDVLNEIRRSQSGGKGAL